MKTVKRFFTSFSDTFRKQGIVGKIILASVTLFVLCCLCSIPIAIMNPSTSTPQANIPAVVDTPTQQIELAPTATPNPVDKYLEEYGGMYDVYAEIISLSDCTQLQEKFDIASENNKRETAGTTNFKATLGYMMASDDRMKELGCYK